MMTNIACAPMKHTIHIDAKSAGAYRNFACRMAVRYIPDIGDRIREVNTITFDVDMESGKHQTLIFRFSDGKATEENTSIAFDHNNNVATVSFNYSAFELEIV